MAESYPLSMPHLDPYDALKVHKSKFVIQYNQDISVDRQSRIVLGHLFKKLKQGMLDTRKVPDVTFVREEGIDAEGLTNEFFSLVMNALAGGTRGYVLFEGETDHLVPVNSEEFYQSGFFEYDGQLIGMSVLHSNVGLVGLSKALTTYMVTQDLGLASCHMSVKDIPDYYTQQAVTEVWKYVLMIQNIFVIKLSKTCLFNDQ